MQKRSLYLHKNKVGVCLQREALLSPLAYTWPRKYTLAAVMDNQVRHAVLLRCLIRCLVYSAILW